jgi:aromatic-L-amino-acid decarboxylase
VPPAVRAKLTTATAEDRARLERDLDALNQRIMLAVQRGGEAYVSNATLNGKFALRACITNFRTTQSDIDKTLEIIRAAARR